MANREAKIKVLSDLLYANCVEHHRDHVQARGSLAPTNSLRHRETRERLRFAKDLKDDNGSRYFTVALVRDALVHMTRTRDVKLPSTPGFDLHAWASAEAKNLHPLLKRARRTQQPGKVAPNDSAMDDAETQPYDLDPWQDRPKLLKLGDMIRAFCAQ